MFVLGDVRDSPIESRYCSSCIVLVRRVFSSVLMPSQRSNVFKFCIPERSRLYVEY
jgi:hypothetical protein